MKKTLLCLVFIMVCLGAFALDQRVFFSGRPCEPVMPVDSSIGLLCKADSSQPHILLSKALREPYSYEWTEKYLAPASKVQLVQLFGSVFSSILPSSSFVLSASLVNADGSVSINARVGQQVLCFVVRDGMIDGLALLN